MNLIDSLQDRPGQDTSNETTTLEPERIIRDPALPVALHGHLVPIDDQGQYVPNFQDSDGVVHFFAPVNVSYEPDCGIPQHELHYYRVAETQDGRIVHDAFPVMPLERSDDNSFPRKMLDSMLMHGEIDSAVEVAHVTAQAYGFEFPEPDLMPPLRTGVYYNYEPGLEVDGRPILQAVKGWREGNTNLQQCVTIATYGTAAELDEKRRELDEVRDAFGLQTAMNMAESMALASSHLLVERDDARLFTDGPPDPFTTNRERERMAAGERAPLDSPHTYSADKAQQQGRNALLHGAAWFEAVFADKPEIDLLAPMDDTVNYAVVVTDTDPWTTQLMVEKFWREPDGVAGSESLTINAYESDDEAQRDLAATARLMLLDIHEKRGLEEMMHRAELDATANGHLSGDRADTRMFHSGPGDRFETLAHRLQGEINPYWNTSGKWIEQVPDETQELPVVSPKREYLLGATDPTHFELDGWDEMVQRERYYTEPAQERHYWQMHYRPAETRSGERLGLALFLTEFPQLPPDFDDYLDEWGMDDSIYPTQARTVELAHFTDEAEAKRFDAEFRGYLVPGILDGPELAPEVAKLEGLSGEWTRMDYDDIVGYMSGRRTIVREENGWRPHNPNAERETLAAPHVGF